METNKVIQYWLENENINVTVPILKQVAQSYLDVCQEAAIYKEELERARKFPDEERRFQAAVAAMQGILSCSDTDITPNELVSYSVAYANKLLQKLSEPYDSDRPKNETPNS